MKAATLLWIVLALVLRPVLWPDGLISAADAPNLIAIVTDDQGRWAMGAYGNREIHTPHMDAIARDGALFTNAFVATPVCSPSRATYLTGLYPTELGITDWISPREAEEGLGLEGTTWPQALQQQGYTTALIGKWHLGVLPEFHPTRLGFDHFMGFLSGGNRPMNPTLEVNGKETKLEGPLPDLLTDDAIAFVRKNRSRPFALCLHFRAPHLRYTPVPAVDSAHYDDLDPTIPDFRGLDVAQVKKKTKEYYGSISSVDRNIGRLLAALDELGLTENSLVIFTSDHGYNEGRHGVNTKGNGAWIVGGRGGPKRPNMWDTSVTVPLAMRWPKVIKPGIRIEYPVSSIDMFRFVLGALDLPVPPGAMARGIDFSPLVRGESLPPREAIYAQYDLHNNGLAYMRMIRTSRYKYVRRFRARMMNELYDLQKDPGEERNLIRSRRAPRDATAIAAGLDRRLVKWMESIKDPVLEDRY